MPYANPMGKCERCGKQKFKSKKAARNYSRWAFPKDRVTIYICGGFFHFGHSDRLAKSKARRNV